jgi:hypothetical protein
MTKKTNKLIEFWQTKVKDVVKTNRAAKSLQRQAEIDVANSQDEFESSKERFEEAKMNAKDNIETGFKNIVEAHRDMLIAEKKFSDSVHMYEELFEEKPRLLD